MKVSGFTIIRNGIVFDFPFRESISSLLPMVDEMIVNVGDSEDDTLKAVEELRARAPAGCEFRVLHTPWPLDSEGKLRGGKILSEQTNLALAQCTGDWCIYLQGDEVLHELDRAKLRDLLQLHLSNREVEALLFNYIHLYGSYDVVQDTRSAYRREIRALKRSSGGQSIGDAQSFRKADGSKLRALDSGCRVYHYGWVRPPEVMRRKTLFMDRLFHGARTDDALNETPHTGDNYKYKRFWGLRRFEGSHPQVMEERIGRASQCWDLRQAKWEGRPSDIIKAVLDGVEKITGYRPFEYRSYRLIRDKSRRVEEALTFPGPLASVMVSTFNAAKHLELVLAALERQSFRSFEIVVCDDGSGSETREVISAFQKTSNIPLLHVWQENLGFRKCRILNEGVRKARGDLLIFLDGDCVPHRDFVLDHVSNQEPGTYLAGRRVELGQKFSEKLTAARIAEGLLDRPCLALAFSAWRGDSQHLQRSMRVRIPLLRKLLKMDRIDDLKGCNYSVRREHLLAINGFDEGYEGYGREDTDVELRLQNLGLKIKSLKGLALQFHVWHERREFTPRNEERLEELRRSRRIRCRMGLVPLDIP